MPEQISRYYETIEDLETHHKPGVERTPILKVDWGGNRVLTEQELGRVTQCFVALPGPDRRDQHRAYNFYIGGLIFLSLNDIHWQCEVQAFGNFLENLRAMEDIGDWKNGTPFESAFTAFLDNMFPDMDERSAFIALCRHFDANNFKEANVTLKEVAFMKLFCDSYFLKIICPKEAR